MIINKDDLVLKVLLEIYNKQIVKSLTVYFKNNKLNTTYASMLIKHKLVKKIGPYLYKWNTIQPNILMVKKLTVFVLHYHNKAVKRCYSKTKFKEKKS